MIKNKEFTIDNCIAYLADNISNINYKQNFTIRKLNQESFAIKNNTQIKQGELKENLEYNSDTGIFHWLKDDMNISSIGSVAVAKSNGYVSITLNGRNYMAHRLAWLYVKGSFPKNHIDHINGIRNDNRIVNLRDVTHAENCKNSKIASNNTSGFRGVEWVPSRNKWRALITSNGKKINVGSHSCKIDAIAAVIRARKEYGFHPNHGRKSAL